MHGGTVGRPPHPVSDLALALLRRRQSCSLRLEHEVVPHLVKRLVHHLAVRGFARGTLHEIHDKRLLHAVDDILLDVLVALLEEDASPGHGSPVP